MRKVHSKARRIFTMMSKPNEKKIIAVLMKQHGRTFSSELEIKMENATSSALFRWLCASLLFSARIGNEIATEAARALTKSGWTTAQKMAAATWEERTRVLNHAGYARYDEKTSRMLADTSNLLLKCYNGDLRKLREVQTAWTELQPFADAAALRSAGKLDLPTKAEELAKLVPKKDFPRLVAALVRCQLAKDPKEVLAAARGKLSAR